MVFNQPSSQTEFLLERSIYSVLRVDLLQSIRKTLVVSPARFTSNSALDWIDKAIAAAASKEQDWVVEFFLGHALNALSGKRSTMCLSDEIQFAILEFQN